MSKTAYYLQNRIGDLESRVTTINVDLQDKIATRAVAVPFTPEAYGGIADGVIDPVTGSVSGTDNRLAIQSCLAEHGKCYLGEGVYAISHFVACTQPIVHIYADSRDRTTIALLDNTDIDHNDLLGWGTYRPDCIFVGSGATDVLIENITFDNNGRNRRVTNKDGYTEPHSNPISWTGYNQRVRNCRFKNLQAAGGSTSSARTPEMPEAFCIKLCIEPTTVGHDELGEWVEVPGASFTDNEIIGPLCPQTDPYDFGLTATPEITFVSIGGLSVSWKHSYTANVSGTTLTTTENFFESWMEGKPASLGNEWNKSEFEKVKIVTVVSPTQATIEAPTAGSWTAAKLRVLKRTRILHTNGEISRNTFKDLKIWRTTDTDKQIRALHGITCVDCRGYRIDDNKFQNFDGAAVYMDAWVIMDMSISRNIGIKCLYGIGPGMADYALTVAGGSGWWRNIYITDNIFQHGLGEFARLWYVLTIKYGSTDAYRITNLMGSFADGVVVGIPVSDRDDITVGEADSNFDDFFMPSTPLLREQTHCIENIYWTGNNLQVIDDFYNKVFHISFWDSARSCNWIFITDNVLDMLTWNEGNSSWLHPTDEQILTAAYSGPQIRIGYNYRSFGTILSLWDVAADGQIYPQLPMVSPNGFSRDVPFRINNLTIGAAFNTIGPDGSGFIWWATDAKENNGVNQRYSDLEWAGNGDYALKLVFPKPTLNYDLSSGEVRAGTQFRFINNSSVGATVDLYWNKAGIPTLILAAVPVGDIVHMTVDSDGYRYQKITPTSGKST